MRGPSRDVNDAELEEQANRKEEDGKESAKCGKNDSRIHKTARARWHAHIRGRMSGELMGMIEKQISFQSRGIRNSLIPSSGKWPNEFHREALGIAGPHRG